MQSMRQKNVFGALALLVADEIVRSASAQAPEGGPASAALALLHHEPGLSIRKLAERVALSHAGAVRLVDRMVAEGLVERRGQKSDGRARLLHLTVAGETAGKAVLLARNESLVRAFSVLNEDEIATLGTISERMLRALLGSEEHAGRVCRLCDRSSCLNCPVDDELRSREAACA
jgi:DNA-binding MarR family transcriptional regulator